MSAHDTHNPDIENSGQLKSKTSFKASFWFVIILVGLFIAALNFVKMMSNDHEAGHGGHGTEQTTEGHEGREAAGHEAEGVEATGHETEATAKPAAEAHAATDSADAAAHH